MKGYGQYCPVAKAAEIVAERWTPLVLRELMSGSTRFNDLHRGVPLMSPSLLDPGFDVDLLVRAPLRTLTQIWLGDDTFARAIAQGDLVLEGPRDLVRAFPSWIELSPIINVPRMRA